MLSSLSKQLQALALHSSQIMTLLDFMTYMPTGSTTPASQRIVWSPKHSPQTCQSFLALCSLTFELQLFTFVTEYDKVAFIINSLMRRAYEWATAECERCSSICDSVAVFSTGLVCVFGHVLAFSGKVAAMFLAMPSYSSH